MGIFATAGDKFYIGSAAMDPKSENFVASDFSAVTWVEVKQLTNLGSLGDEAQSVTADLLGEQRTQSAKGTRRAAVMTVEVAILPTDLGQQAMIAAEASPFNYPFKVELNDKPAAGASPKNSTRLFVGQVMTSPENYGGANDVTRQSYNVQPNSNIVRVAASAS